MTAAGIDLTVPGPTSADDWWVLMFEVRQRWPDAVFHRTGPGEMTVYPHREAFQQDMAAETTDAIRVFLGPENLRLVLDEKDLECVRVGREVAAVLREKRV